MEVIAQVAGGSRQIVKERPNVAEVRRYLELDTSYAATVNGSPAEADAPLQDGDYVSFTKSVKGGRA